VTRGPMPRMALGQGPRPRTLAAGLVAIAAAVLFAGVLTLDGRRGGETGAELLGVPLGRSGPMAGGRDMSWVQVLAGEAVEPMLGEAAHGAETAKTRARHAEPPGWRHALVLSAAMGKTAPWAAQAEAAEQAARVVARGPAVRLARARAAAERQSGSSREQEFNRVLNSQVQRAGHATEEEERLAAAGDLQQSLRTIASYMAPSGKRARSRFQRAVDNFMAKEQKRERASEHKDSRMPQRKQEVTRSRRTGSEERIEKQQEGEERRMRQAKEVMRKVKSKTAASKKSTTVAAGVRAFIYH
jgi:hypothetical protein